MRLDLHLHTTFSDGSFSPAQVLEMARASGVSAAAITDHDTIDGIADALAAAGPLGIEVVPGIEISARFREASDETELHVLGYFVDWQNLDFQTRLAHLRTTRHTRNPLIIDKLNSLGIEISYDEVLALAGTGAVGRPHIARILMDKGYVRSAKEAFDRYLAAGAAAYVPRELPDPADAIAMIRAAGGVPVLAHPSWLERLDNGVYKTCERLKLHGLLGMEVHYSTHKPEQTAQYLDTAKRLELLVTGGSDFHGVTKPDIEVGSGRGSLTVPEKLLEPLRNAAARA
jgi:predicted metal-dependent phosphoesterase TrpH